MKAFKVFGVITVEALSAIEAGELGQRAFKTGRVALEVYELDDRRFPKSGTPYVAFPVDGPAIKEVTDRTVMP